MLLSRSQLAIGEGERFMHSDFYAIDTYGLLSSTVFVWCCMVYCALTPSSAPLSPILPHASMREHAGEGLG